MVTREVRMFSDGGGVEQRFENYFTLSTLNLIRIDSSREKSE